MCYWCNNKGLPHRCGQRPLTKLPDASTSWSAIEHIPHPYGTMVVNIVTLANRQQPIPEFLDSAKFPQPDHDVNVQTAPRSFTSMSHIPTKTGQTPTQHGPSEPVLQVADKPRAAAHGITLTSISTMARSTCGCHQTGLDSPDNHSATLASRVFAARTVHLGQYELGRTLCGRIRNKLYACVAMRMCLRVQAGVSA